MALVDKLVTDRSAATPLYLQLAQSLRQAISAGFVEGGEALPSERLLSEQTGASRVTIRRALEQLIDEGLIVRRHGSGTYLAPRIQQPGSELTGFSSDTQNRGASPSSVWIMKTLARASEEEALALGLTVGASVVHLARVRLANGEPLAIEEAVLSAELLPPVDEIGDSLYAALATKNNRPVSGRQRLTASLATSIEAGLLSIQENSEVLRIERRTFRADGTPVELTRSAYRGDRYEFVSELKDV
jgi:GntR family transcriptional regulator